MGSYTWLCRIRQLVHRSKSEVCLHQNYFELYIVGVIKVIEESYTWLYLISQKWCLQAAKKNELHIVVLIVGFCRVERAIIQPAGREQSALSDPAREPGGGLPRFKLTFHKCTFAFHSTVSSECILSSHEQDIQGIKCTKLWNLWIAFLIPVYDNVYSFGKSCESFKAGSYLKGMFM